MDLSKLKQDLGGCIQGTVRVVSSDPPCKAGNSTLITFI